MEPDLIEASRTDMAEASKAMADTHRFIHGPGGWHDCAMDPCHSVAVLLGDMALLLMDYEPSSEPRGVA